MLKFLMHPDAPAGFVAYNRDEIPIISLTDDGRNYDAVLTADARRPQWTVPWDELAGGRFDICYA